ncbi:hypothetical protein CBW55_23255 [Yersinia intermedia]|nr:hypothetical protein CBW55_23255 [Yersinia intermedia]
MDITKSREEFEKQFPIPKHVIRCGTGYAVTSYGAWEANSYLDLWKGWLAGRESIELELPMRLSPCRSGYGYTLIPNDIGEALEYDNVVEKLHAQGIRIKGESE